MIVFFQEVFLRYVEIILLIAPIIAAIAAIIAAIFASKASDDALRAILSISLSRASRLEEEANIRSSSFCRNHSSARTRFPKKEP